jgi:hypothetical protein
MFRKLTLACMAALGVTAAGAAPAAAAPADFNVRIGFGGPVAIRPGFGHDHRHHWHERVFDCRFEARRFARLMRDRGFEVRVSRHRDHFHVAYRR